VPRGQSLRARLLVLELGPGEVDFARLTACQRDAAAGLYAAATAGYVRWLAARYPDTAGTPALLRAAVARLRAAATAGTAHRRTPALVAELAAGWELWLTFAVEVGAITAAEAETHRRPAGRRSARRRRRRPRSRRRASRPAASSSCSARRWRPAGRTWPRPTAARPQSRLPAAGSW
jgi:hypothetical protein